MKCRNSLATVLAALCCALALPAAAQLGATAADVASYDKPDRAQKLVEGAKKEGALTIYTSAQNKDMGALVDAFQKKYGVKVEMWRASSEKVLQRAIQEARAGRSTMDVAETNGPELESMHREKILQAVKSPYQADLIPEGRAGEINERMCGGHRGGVGDSRLRHERPCRSCRA